MQAHRSGLSKIITSFNTKDTTGGYRANIVRRIWIQKSLKLNRAGSIRAHETAVLTDFLFPKFQSGQDFESKSFKLYRQNMLKFLNDFRIHKESHLLQISLSKLKWIMKTGRFQLFMIHFIDRWCYFSWPQGVSNKIQCYQYLKKMWCSRHFFRR